MKTRHPTRGSVYIIVLGAAMLVTLIGLSAMLVMQIQNRATGGVNDAAEARLYARSALEMGMYWIRTDPFWRTHKGNGAWAANVPIGGGSFSLDASDPVDGDIRTGASDPVLLTGTGVKGLSRYRLQVRLETAQVLGSCLEVSMHAGRDLITNATTLNSDQTISANRYTSGISGAQIYADAEAVTGILGGTYNKAIHAGITARTMPDPSSALSYYTANGTAIAYTDLRLWGTTEMLANTSFETATAPWYALGSCTLSRSSAYKKDGTYSCRVYNRADANAVAAQDLDVSKILNGYRYHVKLPILLQSVGAGRASLTLQSTGSGTQTYLTSTVALVPYVWTDLAGDFTPTWTGQLTKATVSVKLSNNAEFHTDAVSFYDSTYPADAYVADRQLLSPAVNPFGSNQTNAKGIYVINCSGRKVIIANSRIIGTLVILGAGSSSIIQGSVCWEPGVANYPALLTDGTIPVALSATPLSETTLATNFNPSGAPYPYVGGLCNTTATDAYPSLIKGLIYSTSTLLLQGQTATEGPVVANSDITVQGSTVNLKFNSTWLNTPPPRFDLGTTKKEQVTAGSWKRVVP